MGTKFQEELFPIKLIYFPENKKEDILEIINENDNEFKYHLDRFKYAT